MFYVGQKVVCVDRGPSARSGRAAFCLQEGAIYTVIGTYTSKRGNAAIIVAEVAPEALKVRGFLASRFRPIVERKTDISIFKAMLNPSKQGVDA